MKKYPKVVAIDFDETLGLFNPKDVANTYKVKKVTNAPNPRMVKLIKEYRKKGYRVIIWSSRWWGDYNALTTWLKKYKIEVDDIVLGRLKADVYICDKSVNAHHESMEAQADHLLTKSDSWGCWYDFYIKKGNKYGK